MLKRSDEELFDMTLVHAIQEPEVTAGISSVRRNVHRPIVFEEASNPDGKLLICQEELLFTTH